MSEDKTAPTMTSNRPYLMRALYEWITDNGLTPYLLIDANYQQVSVPQQYVQDGRIVLNISPIAIKNLIIRNTHVEFEAHFSGVPQHVYAPMGAVLAIYAKENGRGMLFNEEEESSGDGTTQPPIKGKPHLKVIK